MVGHLRPVKDPFLTARAARDLPSSSRVQILHLGGALTKEMEGEALREEAQNQRYRWLGDIPRWKVLRLLARSHLFSITSQMEGGANALGEAVALSVPSVSTRISGSLGILGDDYSGYFEVGDQLGLCSLIKKAEEDEKFYGLLKEQTQKRACLFEPEEEVNRWKKLLKEIWD